MTSPDTYTPIQVETALCVFEYLMDRADREPFKTWFEDIGWAQMRLSSIDTAVWIDQVTAGLEFDCAFDWDIVPFLLGQLDWTAWLEGTAYGGDRPFPAVAETRHALLRAYPTTKVSA